MRKLRHFVVLSIAVGIALVGDTWALPPQGQGYPPAPPNLRLPPKNPNPPPLSIEDCHNLGGHVYGIATASCASGKLCAVYDAAVCIT
jgi:hypothetical protein